MPNTYYINRNDKIRGPFSEERVRELYAEGKLRDTDLLSTRSDGGWEPASRVLNPGVSKRPATKVKAQSPAAVKSPRRALWIVLAAAAAALIGVGVWRFGFPQPDVAEVATTHGVPSEIASQPTQDNPKTGHETKPSISVEFGGLAGASIGWVVDGRLERRQVAVPGKQEFQCNTRQQLYIDNVHLEGLEGVSFYPTLEIRKLPDIPAKSPERTGIKLDLTGDDFAAANAGVLVTKVWYTKSESPTVIEMLNNSLQDSGADPEIVAMKEGTVAAVFRMGNRSRNLESPALSTPMAPAEANALGSAIVQQPQTIQLRLIGLDGMSIGWVSEGKEYRNQLSVPGRTEVRVGEPFKLILENVPIAGWEGLSLFPTLVIQPLDRSTAIFLKHVSIPIEFNERDLLSMREDPGGTRIIAYDPALIHGPRSSGNPSPMIAFSLGDPATLNEQSRSDLVPIASLRLGDPGLNRSARPVLPRVAPKE